MGEALFDQRSIGKTRLSVQQADFSIWSDCGLCLTKGFMKNVEIRNAVVLSMLGLEAALKFKDPLLRS